MLPAVLPSNTKGMGEKDHFSLLHLLLRFLLYFNHITLLLHRQLTSVGIETQISPETRSLDQRKGWGVS